MWLLVVTQDDTSLPGWAIALIVFGVIASYTMIASIVSNTAFKNENNEDRIWSGVLWPVTGPWCLVHWLLTCPWRSKLPEARVVK